MQALCLLLVAATAVVAQQEIPQEGVNRVEGCETNALDIVFVVDSSGSIQEQDTAGWERVKMFITQVTRQFDIGPDKVRVAIVVYSEFAPRTMDDPRVGDNFIGFFDLNTFTDSASLEEAVSRLYYFNSLTNTQDGLNVAWEVIFSSAGGDRPNVPNLAVVITDGVSNVMPEEVENQANQLKAIATVVAVGVAGANVQELQTIASEDNLVLQVTDFQALENELNRILTRTCEAIIPPSRDDDRGRCCDFDGDYGGTFCDFEQAGISRFTLKKEATPSKGTGPEAADTGAFYAYLEASNLDEGDNAELWWTGVGINGSCLTFAYNMYGSHVGQLFVETRETANDEFVDIFNVTEATSEGWEEAVLELDFLVRDLRFRAVRGAGYQGDIALDSVRLVEGSCYEPEEEEMDDANATGINGTCPTPEPPKPQPMPAPVPPIILFPFFQQPQPGMMMPGMAGMPGMPPPPGKDGDDDEEEEEEPEVDYSKAAECQVKEPFQILLVGGPNATLGRVEVYFNKTMGTICNGTFTENEASAVCRAAGYIGGRVLTDLEGIQTLDPSDETPILLDNVRCKPGEDLGDCCRSKWGKVSCDHSQDAYVICDDKPAFCNEPEEGDDDTVDRSLCSSNTPAFSVVLRDGEKPSEGRVEIYYEGQFGTVCNDSFGVYEAMAVCKSLGYYAGNVWRNPPEDLRLAQGVDRPVLMSGVSCGSGSALKDCCYNAIGFDDGCTHEQDVFVRCYDRPEKCMNGGGASGGCKSPPKKRKRPEPEAQEDGKDGEGNGYGPTPPPMPPLMPQIFPIPLNPVFSFGQQMPGLGGGAPPNMMPPQNGQGGGD